ncbi:MAG: hypothetical protein J5940_06510 [Clostridia bacterium]|nr:hypothetical protein [Clostridia bacterium]
MTKNEANLLSGGALAYVGDAILELLVRERLVETVDADTGVLSQKARDYVSAKAQARITGVLSELSEEETAIYRRGRNSHSGRVPHSATPAEYRRATGFEALAGWLYLTGERERLYEVFDLVYRTE